MRKVLLFSAIQFKNKQYDNKTQKGTNRMNTPSTLSSGKEPVKNLAHEITYRRYMLSRDDAKFMFKNVDFYSGFVYDMLGIPKELYTAIFAVARIVCRSAHRIEEIVCTDKIIRPAYMSVM